MINFSLLICVYEKEDPQYLKLCLESVGGSSVLPNEIVIVKDGPLTPELDEVLADFIKCFQSPEDSKVSVSFNIISLPVNVTLGPARAAGVEAAKYEWVAIMDSDDICRPDRFEKQMRMIDDMPDLGLIGGQIAEFIDDPGCAVATRAVPIGHDDIVRFAMMRNPFNHMTVMFKREAVVGAGNYRYFPMFEDYDLWTRMINNGTICANLPDVLVDARIGSGMYGRRRGLAYIGCEWRMQKQLRSLGLVNFFGFARNVILRIPVRLLPSGLLAGVYRRFTRKSS